MVDKVKEPAEDGRGDDEGVMPGIRNLQKELLQNGWPERSIAQWQNAEWGGGKCGLRTAGGMETAAFRSNIPDS
jgi:hypothetical protein